MHAFSLSSVALSDGQQHDSCNGCTAGSGLLGLLVRVHSENEMGATWHTVKSAQNIRSGEAQNINHQQCVRKEPHAGEQGDNALHAIHIEESMMSLLDVGQKHEMVVVFGDHH